MEMTLTAAPAVAGVVGERAEGDLSLGLVPQKLARTTAYPFRMMNPFPSYSSIDPTFYNPSTHCRLSDFYDVAGNAAAATSLQPFCTSPFKNPGVGMGTYLKYPFTWSQWKELERQALIYKHMVASAPIPPDLLIPFSNRNFTEASANLGRCVSFNMRLSNGSDPEPGRCRRTDGKKWRCSRDAAPDQKYCERHMHRGRPRSRKPVETRNSNAALSEAPHQSSSGFLPKPESKLSFPSIFSSPSLNKDRPSPVNPLVLQRYEEHLSLNMVDYGNGVSKTEQNNHSSFYLKNDFASDARATTSKENQANFSISSLTLSIPEDDMDQTQMGGPLGEILALQSSAGAGSSSASSPSCVLQRTFASLSDSSSSSSPTFDKAKSDIALQWLMP
ncbi:hypothetical protein AAC387_Pa08g1668 [Persea americana]